MEIDWLIFYSFSGLRQKQCMVICEWSAHWLVARLCCPGKNIFLLCLLLAQSNGKCKRKSSDFSPKFSSSFMITMSLNIITRLNFSSPTSFTLTAPQKENGYSTKWHQCLGVVMPVWTLPHNFKQVMFIGLVLCSRWLSTNKEENFSFRLFWKYTCTQASTHLLAQLIYRWRPGYWILLRCLSCRRTGWSIARTSNSEV